MPNILELILKTTDEATSNLKKIEKQTQDTSQVMANLGQLLTVGIVAKGFQMLIKQFEEVEKARTLLNTALKSTNQYTEQASQSMIEYAGALEYATNVSDELIIETEALLLRYNLAPEVVKRLTALSLDLSVAMGIDLRTATLALGQATEGEYTALKRLKLSLDDTKVATQGFNYILSILETKFSGTAKAIAESGIGPIKKFQIEIGNITEDISIDLIPQLGKLSQSTLGITKDLSPAVKTLVTFVSTFIILADTALKSIQFFAKQGLDAIINVFDVAADSIKMIWTQLTKSIGSLLKGDFKNAFKDSTTDIVNDMKDKSQKFAKNFGEGFDKLTSDVENNNKAITDIWSELTESLSKEDEKFTEKIIENSEKKTVKIEGDAERIAEAIRKEEEEAGKSIQSGLEEHEKIREGHKENLEERLQDLRDFRQADTDDIIAYLENTLALETLSRDQRMVAEQLLHDYKRQKAVEDLELQKRVYSEMDKIGKDFFTSLALTNEVTAEQFKDAWDSVKKMFADILYDMLKDQISKGMASLAVSGAKASGEAMAAHAGIPFVGIAIGLVAAAAIVSQINQAKSSMPKAAQGMTVRKPTTLLAGESGPEVIKPEGEYRAELNAASRSANINNNITLNISGLGSMSGAEVDRLAKILGDAVEQRTIEGIRLAQKIVYQGDKFSGRSY